MDITRENLSQLKHCNILNGRVVNMPLRKQKNNMKKLSDVLKECRISGLTENISNQKASAQLEKLSGNLDSNQNVTNVVPSPKAVPQDSSVGVPPIFLHQPVAFEEHVLMLLSSGVKFYQPHLGRVYTKIKCLSPEDYRGLIQYLKSNKLFYHTYGNPDHRKPKVVIRGLPKDTCLNALKNELESNGIPVVRLHKMHTKQTAKEHPLLVLAILPTNDDAMMLMHTETLLGKKVKMETPVNKPRQCHRCQKWGHSQRYCHGQVRCVKCAGDHMSSACTKDPSEPPKCANCNHGHTANYKKCSHCPESENYKETQKLKATSNKCNAKLKIVTLSNYQDDLYKNIISFPKVKEGKENLSDSELDVFEEVY